MSTRKSAWLTARRSSFDDVCRRLILRRDRDDGAIVARVTLRFRSPSVIRLPWRVRFH